MQTGTLIATAWEVINSIGWTNSKHRLLELIPMELEGTRTEFIVKVSDYPTEPEWFEEDAVSFDAHRRYLNGCALRAVEL